MIEEQNHPCDPAESPVDRTARLVRDLHKIEVFQDLPEEGLVWLVGLMDELCMAPGDTLVTVGDPAEHLVVLLEGEVHARRPGNGGNVPTYVVRAGMVTGMLPFSRLTHHSVNARAVSASRGLRLHKNHFPEMLSRLPELNERLVGVLSDRVRESTKVEQQNDKLMSLGKLSAGLAHELNNPAAAAKNASAALRDSLKDLAETTRCLPVHNFTAEQVEMVLNLQFAAVDALGSAKPLDAIDQSDREEEFICWLEHKGVKNAWEYAPGLVEAGIESRRFGETVKGFPPGSVGDVAAYLTASIAAQRLALEIETSVSRISELVAAIKDYSYMDQSPIQEVDLHHGLDSTLTILGHKLKKGITVEKDFDPELPKVCAHASELNQVWTNLIDNAIDAMEEHGTLTLKTRREPDHAIVEICDTGKGVPEEIQDRIWDPFFTTKEMGKGTGLGLDTVQRIVRKHHGETRLESKPGDTRFQISLPLRQPKETSKL